MAYNHGVRSQKSAAGVRAIKDVPTSLICILGTAEDADVNKYPLDTPVLISAASNDAFAKLGESGTLQKAVDGVRDQIGANVVIIRIDHEGTEAELTTRMIEKVQLLRGIESVVGEKPKILIAPDFTKLSTIQPNPVVVEMLTVADSLRAFVIANGPDTNETDAIQARGEFGSKRLVIYDCGTKIWDVGTNGYVDAETTARAAGIWAKSDALRSAFHTPSNMEVMGIGGTARPIQYATNDSNSQHNVLNKNQIATIVNMGGGYRLFGTDTCDVVDSDNRFINAVRGGDAIDDALEVGVQWALDRNITKTFIDDVSATIQGFLDNKVAQGDLLPGSEVTADPELNNQAAYAQGQVYFNYDYAIPTPAVDIQITRKVNYDFSKGIFV
jgi:hypothetical protein